MDKIIQEMSLDEKARFSEGKDAWHFADLPHLGIRSIRVSDGPHGLRRQVSSTDNLSGTDTIPATCFPPAASSSCSMNVDLIREMGAAIGREARVASVDIVLGPGVNIKRSPLCGRNFEYFSEDPWLSGTLGIALIEGLQSVGVGACVKHYAVNNQESYRFSIDAIVDQRALHEIYLRAFEMIVKQAEPQAIMASYNRVNGVYACEHPELIHELLRKEWGYQGLVISDWGAVSNRVRSFQAGLDIEMPYGLGRGTKELIEAVHQHIIQEASIDDSIQRILTTQENLNRMQKSHPVETIHWDEHHQLAKQIALESMVLLKNSSNALPLSPHIQYGIIGELAATPRIQGGGSSHVQAKFVETPLEVLRRKMPEIEYAPGYELGGVSNPKLIQEALVLAEKVDQVLLFVGLTDYDENEGLDRKHMHLSNAQLELISQLTTKGLRPIVLLSGGSAIEMPWYDDVNAILHMHLLGEAGAAAMGDLLWGEVSPSGKLTESYPFHLEDTPCFQTFPGGNHAVHYLESIYVGYRYYDTFQKPVRFPFGFGLSYTTFKYHNLTTEVMNDGRVKVRFLLTNTGLMTAKESAQIYVSPPKNSPLFRASKELKGIVKTALSPNETKQIEFILSPLDFAYYDVQTKKFEVEAGSYLIQVGGSSATCPLNSTIVLDGTIMKAPNYHEACPSYYAPSQGFDDREFVALLGRIPPLEYQESQKITYDTPLALWQDRFIGKMILRKAVKEIKKASEKDSIAPYEATIAALPYTPMRFFVTMGGGAISYPLADLLLALLNSEYQKVFPLLRNLRLHKKEI